MHARLSIILAELRNDHRNIAQMLDLVEAELHTVERGRTPDLELLHDVMQYMVIYSDAIHHPREDLVYFELRRADDALVAGLEQVESDHEAIAELGLSLKNDIGAMISGVEIRRDRVLADMRDYVVRLRGHMQWEDRDLFPLADDLAAKGDVEIPVGKLSLIDPVFGEVRHSVFDNLRLHLEKVAGNAA